MDAQRVRADRARQRRHARRPGLSRLDRAEIGQQQHVGGDFAQPIRLGQGRVQQHRPLRPDPDREAVLLRRRSEREVDLAGLGRAAGHAGDQQRRLELTAEQLERRIHLVPRELRERLVQQLHVREQRPAPRLDVFADTQLEVLELAPRDVTHRRPPSAKLRMPAPERGMPKPSQVPAAIASRRGFESRTGGPRHGKPWRWISSSNTR